LVGAALLLARTPALAGELGAPVHLTLPSCELANLSNEELRSAIALELSTSGLALEPPDGSPSGDAIEASVETSCAADSSLELRGVWGVRTGSRRLDPRELPAPSRARAVALALAELLASLRSPEEVVPAHVELTEEPGNGATTDALAPKATAKDGSALAASTRPSAAPSRLSPASDAPDLAEPKRSGAPRPLPALGLAGELRWFSLDTIVMGVRAHYDFSRFGVGLVVLSGSQTATLGTVTGTLFHGYFEGRFAELGPLQSPWFTLGSRLGLGVVQAVSTPNPTVIGTAVADPYVDLAAFSGLALTAAPFRFGLRLELGYAVGMLALEDGARIASFGGPLIGVLVDLNVLL